MTDAKCKLPVPLLYQFFLRFIPVSICTVHVLYYTSVLQYPMYNLSSAHVNSIHISTKKGKNNNNNRIAGVRTLIT